MTWRTFEPYAGDPEPDGTIPSTAWWLTVDGVEIPPVPLYAPQTRWQRWRKAPRVQTGWAQGCFTAEEGSVVHAELREM